MVDAAAPGALPGSVTGQTFAGATTLLKVRLDGADALVTIAVRGTDATYAAGDRVAIAFDTRRAIYEPVGSPGSDSTNVLVSDPSAW